MKKREMPKFQIKRCKCPQCDGTAYVDQEDFKYKLYCITCGYISYLKAICNTRAIHRGR